MNLPIYRALIAAFVALAIAASLFGAMYGLASSGDVRRLFRWTFIIATASIGCASFLNVACGVQHKIMWGRGGLMDYEKRRGLTYLIDIFAFVALGAFMFIMTARFSFL